VQAFIIQKGGSALAFYDNISDATSVARVTFLLIQSLLGDSVIVSLLLLPTSALLLILEDMATVCGVRQAFLGCHSGAPSYS
jgi:hypothetical protein